MPTRTKSTTRPPRILGYARAGLGDPENGSQIKDLMQAGVLRADLYEDRLLTSTAPRPGWDACLNRLRKHDLLIITALDRLGRDLVELVQSAATLHQRGVEVLVLSLNLDTRTPAGRDIFEIVVAMADWEHRLGIEQRTQGLRLARARGKRSGPPPKVPEDEIREAMARINAGESPRDVAGELGISRQALATRIKRIRRWDIERSD